MHYEVEVVEGLEDLACEELDHVLEVRPLQPQFTAQKGVIQFALSESPQDHNTHLHRLRKLTLSQAVYSVQHYAIPRPKALLGDQYFRLLLRQIESTLKLWQRNTFKTIHIAAAGAETGVMQRILAQIAHHTQLQPDSAEGDLWVRIRPANDNARGWETLVRQSPRPLATRNWRVCNYEGALNATVAQAMVRLSQPAPHDRVFNAMCGSGTLLIERALFGSAGDLVGCDIFINARACCEQNIKAAHLPAHLHPIIYDWDACQIPLPNRYFDVFLTDLPFGQLIGSHSHNQTLYPQLFSEVARLAMPNARFVCITHEIRLMDALIPQLAKQWQLIHSRKVTLRGLHPRIYVFNKTQ
jgi:23S rRNA G2445 N2-methylase RlmL